MAKPLQSRAGWSGSRGRPGVVAQALEEDMSRKRPDKISLKYPVA